MSNQPVIKILVSCHKDIVTPSSDVFLPVHVGAANTKTSLIGMQPDNEGDNISQRNFTYCELSAQYWAWKNLDADYYGLCHYRRFFCFDGIKHPSNDHKQIEVDCLSQFSLAEYRLDDEELIRSVVDQHDMITPPYWNVRGVPTPDTPKKTVADHMIAYGLLTEDAIDLLLSITSERQPEYLADLEAYLRGSKYLGYSCYIMNKQLFNRFCTFEFDILKEFDKRFCYDHLTTTAKRICGYLGEILYSTFVNHVRSERTYDIAQYPLVFFDHTNPLYRFEKPEGEPVRIFWRYFELSAPLMATCLEGLARVIDPCKRYELTIFHTDKLEFNTALLLAGDIPDNLTIRKATWPAVDCSNLHGKLNVDEAALFFPMLLPWLDGGQGRVLWMYGVALLLDDPAHLIASEQQQALCASNYLELNCELNKPINSGLKKTYTTLAGTYATFDPSFMIMDFKAVRQRISLDQIARWCHDIISQTGYEAPVRERGRKHEEAVALSIEAMAAQSALLALMDATLLDFKIACPALGEEEAKTWGSEENVIPWSRVTRPSVTLYRGENLPTNAPENIRCIPFWKFARHSNAYETLIQEMAVYHPRGVKDVLFPPESKRRLFLAQVKGLIRRTLGH